MSRDTGETYIFDGFQIACPAEEMITLIDSSVLGLLFNTGCGIYRYVRGDWQLSNGYIYPNDYVQKSIDTVYIVNDFYLAISPDTGNGFGPLTGGFLSIA